VKENIEETQNKVNGEPRIKRKNQGNQNSPAGGALSGAKKQGVAK